MTETLTQTLCGFVWVIVGMSSVVLVMLAGWEPKLKSDDDLLSIVGIIIFWPIVAPVVAAVLIGRLLKKPKIPKIPKKPHWDDPDG